MPELGTKQVAAALLDRHAAERLAMTSLGAHIQALKKQPAIHPARTEGKITKKLAHVKKLDEEAPKE